MEILFQHLLRQKDSFDEYHIWQNTENSDDIQFFNQLALQHPWVKVIRPHWPVAGSSSIRPFFTNCCERDTVYVRFDDDIVFVEDGLIDALVDFRLDNPDYSLVFPNIINNALCSFIHEKLGVYRDVETFFGYECKDPVGWSSGDVAVLAHDRFLSNYWENALDDYRFDRWELSRYERFSINCMSWLGADFAEFGGVINGLSEEDWLTTALPRNRSRRNCIMGTHLVSHFAFKPQRARVEQTRALELYRQIANELRQPVRNIAPIEIPAMMAV